MGFPFLSAIVFLPAVGAIVIALLPRPSHTHIKTIALTFTLLSFLLSLSVFTQFDRSGAAVGIMQFEEKLAWFPAVGSSYHLGIDGISLSMVLLTTLIGVLAILVSWKVNLK